MRLQDNFNLLRRDRNRAVGANEESSVLQRIYGKEREKLKPGKCLAREGDW